MKKLLVVDDNAAFTDLVEMVFREEFEVRKAGDGQEGIQMAFRFKPDVILLDVMMPRITGLEMLRMLQSDPETAKIPVLIMTASHFDSSTEDLFQQEPNVGAFLQKPCGVEMLRERIQATLAKGGRNAGS